MPAGRPPNVEDTDLIVIRTSGKHKLQAMSDRRAVVNRLVENGGAMTVSELNDSFGFDIRRTIYDLIKAGWLAVDNQVSE